MYLPQTPFILTDIDIEEWDSWEDWIFPEGDGEECEDEEE
jgi:hypothetical protein